MERRKAEREQSTGGGERPDLQQQSELEKRRAKKEADRKAREAEEWAEALEMDKQKKLAAAAAKRRKEEGFSASLNEKDEPRSLPEWQREKLALRAKFDGAAWAPPKRISREAMDLVRSLAQADPKVYTTPALAAKFKISPEAVRRILRSNFELPGEEREQRERRRKEERMKSIQESAAGDGSGAVWGKDFAAESRETAEVRKRFEEQR
jgi:hypothetical protein